MAREDREFFQPAEQAIAEADEESYEFEESQEVTSPSISVGGGESLTSSLSFVSSIDSQSPKISKGDVNKSIETPKGSINQLNITPMLPAFGR